MKNWRFQFFEISGTDIDGPMRNSDEMTIGKTHSTFEILTKNSCPILPLVLGLFLKESFLVAFSDRMDTPVHDSALFDRSKGQFLGLV